MADRYAYIPLIGIFAAVAFTLDEWSQQKKWILVPPAAAAVLALTFATYRQIGFWQTNEQLWAHTLVVTQNNFIAEDNLGGALILEGREEEAFPHFEAAARINPKDPMSHSNLGTYYGTHNRPREAVTQYEAAVEMTSDPGLLGQIYANLGAMYRTIGDDEHARTSFQQALRYNSGQSNAWLGLGLVAQRQGKFDEAISNLNHAIELQPSAEAFVAMGSTLAQSGRNSEALVAYEQALRISPDLTAAQQAAAALRQKVNLPKLNN